MEEKIKESLFKKIDKYIEVNNPHSMYVPMKKSATKLYFIQEGTRGNIKIGVSKEPLDRLDALQTGNSSALRLIFMCNMKNSSVENDIHKIFRNSKIRREWFSPDVEILRFILETISHCFDGTIFNSTNIIFNE